jgi:hypothetical protein
MTDAMLERSGGAARAAGLVNVRFEKADMTRLPLADDSVDVVISNGVINLAPATANRDLRLGARNKPVENRHSTKATYLCPVIPHGHVIEQLCSRLG